MGQLILPSYPFDTEFITPILSVCTQDNSVYYLLSGMPIYSHEKKDLYKFHYITSHLIMQGLCKVKDITKTFQVSDESVVNSLLKNKTTDFSV
jgi:hypothetical protein